MNENPILEHSETIPFGEIPKNEFGFDDNWTYPIYIQDTLCVIGVAKLEQVDLGLKVKLQLIKATLQDTLERVEISLGIDDTTRDISNIFLRIN